MVNNALQELANDRLEIRPGLANVLKLTSRVAPRMICNQLATHDLSVSRHESDLLSVTDHTI